MKNTHVSAEVMELDGVTKICSHETVMTTDLPAEKLGELVAEALNLSWKLGNDPVNTMVVLSFR